MTPEETISSVQATTRAIQARIDECASRGGGVVRVERGAHVVGTLRLRDGVTLDVPEGSRLVGSTDLADYPLPPSSAFVDAVGQPWGRALILAEGARRVGLSGAGAIDGSGAAFSAGEAYRGRPFLCRFVGCSQVAIRSVQLVDAAAWTCHLLECSDVDIEGVRIRAHANHNNDGLDIDGCARVTVRRCDVDTGDDALCLKATTDVPCEDVVVESCRLSSRCGAIKLGTESYGDFRRILIREIEVPHAGLGAIKVLSMDGGVIEDVSICDIDVGSCTGPIFVRLGGRCRTYRPKDPAKPPGRIRNVRISRVRVARVDVPAEGGVNYFTGERLPPLAFSGILVTGLAGHPIEGLSLSEVRARFPGGGGSEVETRAVPEMPADYPEQFYFGPTPAFGVFARHVRGLALDRLELLTAAPDARPEVVLDDVIP